MNANQVLVKNINDEISKIPHGRVPRELRIKHILILAEELFGEKGYLGASMDELAKRAGISKPVIYELVGSKDQLFKACLEKSGNDLAQQISKAVANETDPIRKLRYGGLAFFKFVEEHRQAWSVLIYGNPSSFAKDVDEIRQKQANLVANLIAQVIDALPTPKDTIFVEAAAHAINGAFEALALWWFDHTDISAETLADWFVSIWLPFI